MRILLIANEFFGYADRVGKCFTKLGHIVNLTYTYTPSYADRIKRKIGLNITKAHEYYHSIADNISENRYDFIFVFGGGVPQYFLEELKERLFDIPLVLYMSADLTSYKFGAKYLALFNKVFTYSLSDSLKNNIAYLPWFYSETILREKEIDISFIGSIHNNRFRYLLELYQSKAFTSYIYVYADYLTFLNSFRKWKKLFSVIHSNGLDYHSYINILSISKATLDIPEKEQLNITTRPIEALGCKTKIITTNGNIINYDFYNEDNIMIIDGSTHFHDLKDWIEIPYKDIEKGIKERYDIRNWCNEILKEI